MEKVKLYGDLGDQALDQIRAVPAESPLLIDIDSLGGDLSAGYKIYDLLRERKDVYVNVSGSCMSAAVLVLLAAKKENRTCSKHSKFLIHKPLIPFMGYIRSDDALQMNSSIEEEAVKLVDIYCERTDADRDVLEGLMVGDGQVFSADQALEMGFVSKINTYINKNMSKFYINFYNKAKELFGFKNLVVSTTEGDLEVAGEELVVGAETTAEDGEYHIEADGRTIVVKDGKVESIVDPAGEENPAPEGGAVDENPAPTDGEENKTEDEEKKEMQNKIAELTEMVNKLSSEKAELVNKVGELEADFGKATSILDKLKNVHSADVKVKSADVKEEASFLDDMDAFRAL